MDWTHLDSACDFYCRFEWIGVSSNFFNVEVYTPAIIAVVAIIFLRRMYVKAKKAKALNDKK